MFSLLLALITILFTAQAHAAFIQYKLDTMEVVGISDSAIGPVPNHGVVEHMGQLAASYPWPIPAGCSEGRLMWTRIQQTTPSLVLEVKPDVILFECEEVGSGSQLDEILDQRRDAIARLAEDRYLTLLRRGINALRILVHECPSPGISVPCDNKRSTASTFLDTFRNRDADMRTLEQAAQTLRSDQGW